MLNKRVVISRPTNGLGINAGDEGLCTAIDSTGGKYVRLDSGKAFWFRSAEVQLLVTDTYVIKKPDGGGGQNHYDLPKGATQLQDLIEHRNMNGSVKDIFKACYRLGVKDGVSDEYDLRKMAFYSLRELGRQLGRKDYLTLAKEIIGHQAIEEVEGPEEDGRY